MTDTAFDEEVLEGRLEGEALGIEKCREESANSKELIVARHIKTLGLTVEQIAQATGLRADDIAGLL